MSISLKTMYANEIIESMADTLKDKNFMGLYKKAGDYEPPPLHDPAKANVPTRISDQELFNIARKYLGYQGSLIEFLSDPVAKQKAESYAKANVQNSEDSSSDTQTLLEQFNVDFNTSTVDLPTANEPKDNVEEIKRKYQEATKARGEQAQRDTRGVTVSESQMPQGFVPAQRNMADDVALAFTMKNLAKLAGALDVNGYAGLANIVDGTMNKIASLINKKAFEMGIESIEEDKQEDTIAKAHELLDSGDYDKLIDLISKLQGTVANFDDLYSAFGAKPVSEEE